MPICPSCHEESMTFTEPAPPPVVNIDTAAPAATVGAKRGLTLIRKCIKCRASWPEDAPQDTAPKPAAPIPAAVPLPAPAKPTNGNGRVMEYTTVAPGGDTMDAFRASDGVARRARPQPQPVAPGVTFSAPDYAALMVEELHALDEAEAHIRSRRAYLRRMLDALGHTEPPAELSVAAN